MVSDVLKRRGTMSDIVFWVLALFFVGMSGLWIHLNRAPTNWDDSWYLHDSLLLFDALTDHGLRGWYHAFLYEVQLQYKAPLICALPTPIFFIFGRDPRTAFLMNLALIPVLLWCIYSIVRRFWSDRAALFSVIVAGTVPQLFGLSGWFLVEYGSAALTALAIWSLIQSRDLTRTRWVIFFSFVSGLGLLEKFIFPLYVGPVFAYYFLRWVHRLIRLPAAGDGVTPWPFRTLAALVIPALLIAGPWYDVNFKTTYDRAYFSAFDAAEAARNGVGDPYTWTEISKYAFRVMNEGTGVAYLASAAILLILVLVLRVVRRDDASGDNASGDVASAVDPHSDDRWQRRWLLVCWTLPLVVFWLGRSKDLRFIAPIMPVFAILMGIGLNRLISLAGKAGWLAAMVLLVAPTLCTAQICFQIFGPRLWIIKGEQGDRTSGFHIFSPELGSARMYDRTEWPLPAVADQIASVLPIAHGQVARVWLGTSTAHFNNNTLQLAARQQRAPVIFIPTAYYTDWDALRKELRAGEAFVYREGDGEVEKITYNTLLTRAIDEVSGDGLYEEVTSDIPFADKGKLHIFRRRIAGQGAPAEFIRATSETNAPCDVNFGGLIHLIHFSADRVGSTFRTHYAWECKGPIDVQYRCFVHVVGDDGNIIGYFDHDIVNGQPPMKNWKPGDIARETFSIDLPALEPMTDPHIQIGLYDPKTSAQLEASSTEIASHAGWRLMPRHIGLDTPIVAGK